jgi:hypothetical protein
MGDDNIEAELASTRRCRLLTSSPHLLHHIIIIIMSFDVISSISYADAIASIMHNKHKEPNYSCNDVDFIYFLNTFMSGGRSLPTLNDHGDNQHVHALTPLPLVASPSCSAEDTNTNSLSHAHDKKPTTHQIALPLRSKITTATKTKKRKQQEVLDDVGVLDDNISLTMRRVSPQEGLWSPIVSPSTRNGDDNDDETAPTPKKENRAVVATLTFDDNIGIGSDEYIIFDEDEEVTAQEKLCSTNTTTTNTKRDDNWQQKFSELQVRLLCCGVVFVITLFI